MSDDRMWWEVAAEQNRAMPQSSKEKQEAFRARQAMLGHTEVRGIFLPPELHAALKEYAKRLVAIPQKSRKTEP
jgi:hypothetical protein